MSRAEEIRRQAEKELKDEDFEEAVRREKDRIREERGRPWWARLFPWKITVTRR